MIKGYLSKENCYLKDLKIECVKEKEDIYIDTSKLRQEIIGFGGALTNSSAYLYSLMNQKLKDKFLKALYSQNGLNYNLGRISIGSCDFSLKTYDYLTSDGTLDYSYEEIYLFPLLNDIYKIKELKLMASPWSPPKIYKEHNDYYHGDKLKKEYYKDYASYLVSFALMMKEKGFPLSFITMQNEPEASQVWESCIFTPGEENELILLFDDELKKEHINDIDIYLYDHNRDNILMWVNKCFENERVKTIVKGIAYHFYDQNYFSELSKVKSLYKDKTLLFTEGCVELLLLDKNNPKSTLGSFEHGLKYAYNYLNDCLNYSNGFIDWNVVLDENGGPNHVGNYCEAPILYDKEKNDLVFMPSFYSIYHFSHFIKQMARCIEVNNISKSFLHTAFLNKDGSIVIIYLNCDDEVKDIVTKVDDIIYKTCIDPKSIATVVIDKD